MVVVVGTTNVGSNVAVSSAFSSTIVTAAAVAGAAAVGSVA
jgi:hypothetical protein